MLKIRRLLLKFVLNNHWSIWLLLLRWHHVHAIPLLILLSRTKMLLLLSLNSLTSLLISHFLLLHHMIWRIHLILIIWCLVVVILIFRLYVIWLYLQHVWILLLNWNAIYWHTSLLLLHLLYRIFYVHWIHVKIIILLNRWLLEIWVHLLKISLRNLLRLLLLLDLSRWLIHIVQNWRPLIYKILIHLMNLWLWLLLL